MLQKEVEESNSENSIYKSENNNKNSYDGNDIPDITLKNFFEDVKYEDLRHISRYAIYIKDPLVTHIDDSQIHILDNKNLLLIYIGFKTDKIKKCQLFKVDLGFIINLKKYYIELNQDLMKVNLFFDGDEKQKKVEEMTILSGKKCFFQKILKKIFLKIIENNSIYLYKKKLQKKCIGILKLFYYIQIKQSICSLKLKKKLKKIFWHEFMNNYTQIREDKKRHLLISQHQMQVYLKKTFFTRIRLYIGHSKKLKSRLFEYRNKMDAMSTNKKLSGLNRLKLAVNRKILEKYHIQASDTQYKYSIQIKFMSAIKKNLSTIKKVNQFYTSKLQFKVIIGWTKICCTRKFESEKITRYNPSNFQFLVLILHRLKISPTEKLPLSCYPLAQSFHTLYYLPPMKRAFSLLKNNLFKSIKVLAHLTKLVALFYTKWILFYKKYYKTLWKKILKFKRKKRKEYFHTFTHLILTSARKSFQIKQIVYLHALNQSYSALISQLLTRKKAKIIKDHQQSKWRICQLKFKFYEFLSALFISKNKKKEDQHEKYLAGVSNSFELVSPKSYLKQKAGNFMSHVRMILTRLFFYQMIVHCKMSKIFKMKKKKFNEIKRLYYPKFFYEVFIRVKISKFKKSKREKVVKHFFSTVKNIKETKQLGACAIKTHKDKLKYMTFFILAQYKNFSQEKRLRCDFFSTCLRQYIMHYVLTNYFLNISRLKSLFSHCKNEVYITHLKSMAIKGLKKVYNENKVQIIIKVQLMKSLLKLMKLIAVRACEFKKNSRKFDLVRKRKNFSRIKSNQNVHRKSINKNVIHFNMKLFFRQIRLLLSQRKKSFQDKCSFISIRFITQLRKMLLTQMAIESRNKLFLTKMFYTLIHRQISQRKTFYVIKKKYDSNSRLSIVKFLFNAMKVFRLVKALKILVIDNLKLILANFAYKVKMIRKFKHVESVIKFLKCKSSYRILKEQIEKNSGNKVLIKMFKIKHYLKEFMKKTLLAMIISSKKKNASGIIIKKGLTKLRMNSKCTILKKRLLAFQLSQNAKYMKYFISKGKKRKLNLQVKAIRMGHVTLFRHFLFAIKEYSKRRTKIILGPQNLMKVHKTNVYHTFFTSLLRLTKCKTQFGIMQLMTWVFLHRIKKLALKKKHFTKTILILRYKKTKSQKKVFLNNVRIQRAIRSQTKKLKRQFLQRQIATYKVITLRKLSSLICRKSVILKSKFRGYLLLAGIKAIKSHRKLFTNGKNFITFQKLQFFILFKTQLLHLRKFNQIAKTIVIHILTLELKNLRSICRNRHIRKILRKKHNFFVKSQTLKFLKTKMNKMTKWKIKLKKRAYELLKMNHFQEREMNYYLREAEVID